MKPAATQHVAQQEVPQQQTARPENSLARQRSRSDDIRHTIRCIRYNRMLDSHIAPEPVAEALDAAATATPDGRRSRKRLPLTPQEDNTVASEDSLDGSGLVSPLGEVPQERTKLLAKHTFILNCVDVSSAATRRKTQRKVSAAFDKEHVSRHIEARGGHVLADT